MPPSPAQPEFAMSSPGFEPSEEESSTEILCDAHSQPSTRLVSKTAENAGRAFYICSEKKSCDYFVWEDKLPKTKRRSSRSKPGEASRDPSQRVASTVQSGKSAGTNDVKRPSFNGSDNFGEPQVDDSRFPDVAPDARLQDSVRVKAEPHAEAAGRSLSNTPSALVTGSRPSTIRLPANAPGETTVKVSTPPSSMSWNNARERAMAKRRADLAARSAQVHPPGHTGSAMEPDAATSITTPSTIPSTVIQTPPTSSVCGMISVPHATARNDSEACTDLANVGTSSLIRSTPVTPRDAEKTVPVIKIKQEPLITPALNSSVPSVAGPCPPSDLGKRKEPEREARFTESRKKPCPERETNMDIQGQQAIASMTGTLASRSELVQAAPPDLAITEQPTMLDNLLQQTRPEEWRYLSEGGANVVYVYRGWRDAFKGKALRIKKRSPVVRPSLFDIPPKRRSTTPNEYWHETLLPHVLRNADKDAEDLLPMRQKMRVTSLWIWSMDNHSKHARPVHRMQSQYAELESREHDSLVVLTDDLIGDAGYIAIEIKPKTGFVPPLEGLDMEYVPIKTKACKYCMKRCVTNGQGDFSYGFCPIDLFSKDYAPRSRALESLAEAWKLGDAGNNMKVFVDGEIVHSAAEAKPNANLGDYRDPRALARLVNNALTSSGVLNTLLYLQKLYDRKDIQLLARLASPEGRHTKTPFNEELCIEPHASKWAEMCCRRSGGNPDPLTRQRKTNVRYSCMAYAIAAIFKDCSIMLRWPVEQLSAVAEQTCIVKLVDLDLKPMKNLNKWWQQDRELCSAIQQRGMTVACGAGGIQGSDYRIFRFPNTWKPAREAVPERSQPSKADETKAATAQLLAKAQSDNAILKERTARLERALMNIGVQVVEAGLQTR